MKKFLAFFLAAMMLLSCEAAFAADEAGFEETPIGEEQDVDVTAGSSLHVAAVYFQPVDMEPAESAGLTVEESNMHIEADISWNENGLGYGVGDWLPYATVDYKVADEEGNVVLEGSFMPMNASDGPHYGANVLLEEAGSYTLTFIIHSPAENGFLLHVDDETGPEEKAFWSDPIEVVFEGWDYIPQEW